VAKRETELEDQIYDASLSVVVLIEDVRRGDVIEYSFTRLGTNPDSAATTPRPRSCRRSPVIERYFRLVWPAGVPYSSIRYRLRSAEDHDRWLDDGIRMVGA